MSRCEATRGIYRCEVDVHPEEEGHEVVMGAGILRWGGR